MISGSALGIHHSFQPDRVHGEAPLPYIRGGRRSLIIAAVVLIHAGMFLIPFIWMAVEELNPPVYVMRMPIVESLPNDQPEMSKHPSPAAAKPVGTPDRGKPLSEIPSIPDLVRPVDPPPPKPQPQKKVKPVKPDPVKPTPVKDSKRVAPASVKPQPKVQPKTQPKKNTLLTPDQIKISHDRVKPSKQRPSPDQQRRQAEQQARNARNAAAAQTLRSMTGEDGGRGTPGGGGGPKGRLASREISEYYGKVEAFLKRRWNQPQVYGSGRPKVVIRFRVTSSGAVSYVKIEQLSGVPAMDASVEELIANLSALPAPPQPMEFTVTMEIDR